MQTVTTVAPVNIALIKYWGKRDEDLILPINDSLSMTLNIDEMCATTSIAASSEFKENKMWLNGEVAPFEENLRLMRCLSEIKRRAKILEKRKVPSSWKLHICSENNFPTAAGLASSAAGYACLVYALANLYDIDNEELTAIARQGSGSACRSLQGGFVQWLKGENNDGSDSIAVQVAPAEYWPEMRVLILVVNDDRKKTSSTNGMQRSVKTSELLKYRAEHYVPKQIIGMRKAIEMKDFKKFAEITMKDSNQFHATCLDTYPPCVYMNNVSHAIAEFVHKYNYAREQECLAYTFDAGPNACIYLLDNEVPNAISALMKHFPNDNQDSVEYIKGIAVDMTKVNDCIYDEEPKPIGRNLLKYIIHTKIGNGPRILDQNDSLLNEVGLPKKK